MNNCEYKEYKLIVKELYKKYEELAQQYAKKGTHHETIEKRMSNLNENSFKLVVAGTVKAGKSTFINSFIGEDLLPTAVLQNTKAIIQLKISDVKRLEITYSESNSPVIYHDNFAEVLTESCAVNETKSEEGPVKVEFYYPLGVEFDDFTLIDTPGVDGVGSIQNTTYTFIEQADAILFVHSLAEAIDKESVRNFITKNLSDRKQESLFLVLTQSGPKNSECATKIDEAKRLYPMIAPERIIPVDSIYNIVAQSDKGVERLKEIYPDSIKRLKGEAVDSNLSASDDKIIKDIAKRESNFEKLKEILNNFICQAPRIQMLQILEPLKKDVDEWVRYTHDKIKTLDSKFEDPITFRSMLEDKEREIEEFKLRVKEAVEEILQGYTGYNTKHGNAISEIYNIIRCKIDADISFDNCRALIANMIAEMDNQVAILSNEIKDDLESAIENLRVEYHKNGSYIPDIDYEEIETKSIAAGTKMVIYREEKPGAINKLNRTIGSWLNKNWGYELVKREEFDSARRDEYKKQLLNSKLQDIKNEYRKICDGLADQYKKKLFVPLDKVVNDRRKEIDEIKKNEASNEELGAKIDGLKKRKDSISEFLNKVNIVLNNLPE